MKILRVSLRFILQFGLLLVLLIIEYPLGIPLLTSVIFIVLFSRQNWLYRLFMSTCISFVITLLYNFSWAGVLGFFLIGFWLVKKGQKKGWSQVVMAIPVLLLAIMGLQLLGIELFVAKRTVAVLLWQIVFTLGGILLLSRSSRDQIFRIFRSKKSPKL